MRADEVEILLVEDNPHEAELAIRNLRKSGLANHLVHIEDGAEALEFIFSRGKYADNEGKFSPKLILLDLKLPKVSGHQILKEIRNNPDFRNVPVVMLTSSNEESDLVESYRLGVNSYIVKPMNFDSFSKSIEDVGKYWTMLNKLPF
jgi:CheY-like chemotaxis protein